MSRFEAFESVTLLLNLKEDKQAHAEFGYSPRDVLEDDMRSIAADIRNQLDLHTVVVHPRESTACSTADDAFWVPGPYTDQPLITTGAGDHFNAGYIQGQMLGLAPEACLGLGVCTSGHYVRTAQSPTLDDLEHFLENWS